MVFGSVETGSEVLAALRWDSQTGKYARQAPGQDQVLGNGEGNGTGTTPDRYANGTWWPVSLCQLPGDPHGPLQGIRPGCIYVVICFYQVLDIPLWAWTIEFM